MVFTAVSEQYGHQAKFYSPQANFLHEQQIQWGTSQIYIPSSSPLNDVADVWFHITNINLRSASKWCQKNNISYLGPWLSSQQNVQGFGFRVKGFSRYRYVDDDDDEDDDDSQDDAGNQANNDEAEIQRMERRRMRTRDAGRTPARRKVSDVNRRILPSPNQQSYPSSSNIGTPKDEPNLSLRPQFSAPAMFDDDGVDNIDTMDSDDTQPLDHQLQVQDNDNLDDPNEKDTDLVYKYMKQSDAVPSKSNSYKQEQDIYVTSQTVRDPFRPPTTKYEPFVEAPKVHRLRAALFEDLPMYASPARQSMRQPSQLTQATPGGDMVMHDREQDDQSYNSNMFDAATDDQLDNPEDETNREAGSFANAELSTLKPYTQASFPLPVLPFPVIDDSIAAGREGTFKDSGLLLGRSTRVSFSHNGILVGSKYGAQKFDSVAQSGFAAEVQNYYVDNTLLIRQRIADLLRVHCIAWDPYDQEISNDEASKKNHIVKMPSLERSFTNPAVANATIEQFIAELDNCYEEGDPNALHASIAFSMLYALYKHESEDIFDDSDNLLQRIAKWSIGPASKAFDEPIPEANSLRKALLELCIGNVEQAVDVAIEQDHPRLAMLMARSLEAPKDDLRRDVLAQLASYGLFIGNPEDQDQQDGQFKSRWDRILQLCEDNAQVSVDERMILLVLAGNVAPVARFLEFSWYRLFIMEFLHGKGSSDLSFSERVASAVHAITDSGISTQAPHGQSDHVDVVYHLLRLYAEPSGKYPLTAGVYSNGSFGEQCSPLDSRFPWLLHQVLSALIPQASPKNARLLLADAFSSQLRAIGMPLWSFYIMCSGTSSPYVLKNILIKDWPDMENDLVYVYSNTDENEQMQVVTRGNDDTNGNMQDIASPANENDPNSNKQFMDAETFLTKVLCVPKAWISEAKAYAAHAACQKLDECEYWIACGTEDGDLKAHELLISEVVPEVIVTQDSGKYATITTLLKELESSRKIPDWNVTGGYVLDYFEYVVGIPELKTEETTFFRDMVQRGCTFSEKASTTTQKHAAALMADGVAMVQRAQLLLDTQRTDEKSIVPFVEDLQKLPCSRGIKISLAGEYKNEAKRGRAVALRFASAYPPYLKYLQRPTSNII